MPQPKPLLQSLQHFLIGLALTLKGADKIGHHPLIGGLILLFGVIILGFFFYLLVKRQGSARLTLTVHWFEALASLFTAYVYYTEGSRYLHFVFLLAAIGFFISIVLHYRRGHG